VLKITLKKRATCRALGLGKLSSSRVHPDNPQVRGMVKKVVHLVNVEQVDEMPGGE